MSKFDGFDYLGANGKKYDFFFHDADQTKIAMVETEPSETWTDKDGKTIQNFNSWYISESYIGNAKNDIYPIDFGITGRSESELGRASAGFDSSFIGSYNSIQEMVRDNLGKEEPFIIYMAENMKVCQKDPVIQAKLKHLKAVQKLNAEKLPSVSEESRKQDDIER